MGHMAYRTHIERGLPTDDLGRVAGQVGNILVILGPELAALAVEFIDRFLA